MLSGTKAMPLGKCGNKPLFFSFLKFKQYIILLALLAIAGSLTAQSESAITLWQREALRQKLPVKFATLPWALTNCDASFHSRHAEGAWALSAPAAVRYGLRVDEATDERRDTKRAAQAAISYLADLATLYNNDEIEMLTAYLTPIYGESAEAKAKSVLTDMIRLAAAPSKLMVKEWKSNLMETELQQSVTTDSLLQTLQVSATVFFKNNPQLSTKAKQLPQGTTIKLTAEQQTLFLANEQMLYRTVVVEEPKQEEKTTESAPAKPSYITYKVKNGDTLSGIAARHHVTVAQLVKWNKLPNADRLSLGQQLKIYK